jgi:hypothetical protein
MARNLVFDYCGEEDDHTSYFMDFHYTFIPRNGPPPFTVKVNKDI